MLHECALVLGIFLFGNALGDADNRTIRLWFLLPFAAMGVIFSVRAGRTVSSVFFAMIPGLILLSAGAVSRGAVGYGDGLVLISAGLFRDFSVILIFAAAGFLLVFVRAAVLFMSGKAKNTEIPFIPYLFAGYVLTEILFI